MKIYGGGGSGVIAPKFLISAGQMVSFTPLLLYPRRNSPHFPSYRRLGEFRALLAVIEKRKITYPYWKSNPDSSVVQLVVAMLIELS
jgi:hypothetical protein